MINLLNDGLIDELPVEKRHVSALVDVYKRQVYNTAPVSHVLYAVSLPYIAEL